MLNSSMTWAKGQTHPWCDVFDFSGVVLATSSAVLGPVPLFMQGCAVSSLDKCQHCRALKNKEETFFNNHNKTRSADTQTAAQQINKNLELCYVQALSRSFFLYFKEEFIVITSMSFFLVNGLRFDSFISALRHNFSIKNRSRIRQILTDFLWRDTGLQFNRLEGGLANTLSTSLNLEIFISAIWDMKQSKIFKTHRNLVISLYSGHMPVMLPEVVTLYKRLLLFTRGFRKPLNINMKALTYHIAELVYVILTHL